MNMQKTSAQFAILTVILIHLLSGLAPAQSGEGRELVIKERFKRVVLVRLGENRLVDELLFDQVSKEIDAQAAYDNVALILEIDSGGGDAYWAKQIVELILSYRDSESMRIFAYVPKKAYSAAAWLAFACRGLIIEPDAQIGDIQPIIDSYGRYERAPEKIVTALTEDFRISCQRNGLPVRYPRLFLEAMVDKDIEIVAIENRKLGTTDYIRADDWNAKPESQKDGLTPNYIGLPGKAFTTNGADLLEYGFTVKLIVGSFEKLIDMLGAPNVELQIREVKQPRSFGFPSFDASFLLLIAGIVLLVLEMKTPGLGLFGIGGILVLITFFLVRAGYSDAALWPISLFLVGIFLIIVEVVIMPGLIAPGLVGLALVLYATWSAVAYPGETGLPPIPDLSDPVDSKAVQLWAGSLIGGLCGGFAFTFIVGKFLHKLPILNKLVLVQPRHVGPVATQAKDRPNTVEIGARGKSITALRPSGAAMFSGKRINVITDGRFVDKGSPLKVTATSGNRVVVKEIKAENS